MQLWYALVLYIVCGVCHVRGITREAPLTIQGAINIVRRLFLAEHEQNIVLGDNRDMRNIWEILAVDERPINISEECYNGTKTVLKGLIHGQEWAVRVIDATGKVESGVLDGNLNWWGSFTECWNILVPEKHGNHSLQDGDYIFEGLPCTAVVSNSSVPDSPVKLVLGVCVPSTCSEEDVSHMVNTLLFVLPEEVNTTNVVCHPREPSPLDTPAIAMISVLSVLGFLILMGTVYDLVVVQGGWQQIRGSKAFVVNDDLTDEEPILNFGGSTAVNEVEETVGPQVPEGLFSKLLVSFSVYTNGAKILSTERTGASLDAVHGVRFISMSWVILGHTYVVAINGVSNQSAILDIIKTWHFQAVVNALVSVDSFFVLSGLLVAYLTLKELERCEGPRKFNWAKFYFHRFWRLTPPYMLVLGTHVALTKYWGDGPIWPRTGVDPTCESDWWTNLLYINNLVPNHMGCMSWAWYLANDMQFFILSPIFIVTLYWNWIAGLVITLATILASCIATALINIHYGYGAGMMDTLTNPNMATWFNDLYIKPWCRIGAYLVGILYGYLIFKTKRQFRIHKAVVTVCWLVAAATALAVLYGLYGDAQGHPLSQPVAALYAALNHTVWGVAVGWVVFACVTGQGGWVNAFLSWPAMIPLSRLSYMAYLVHPVVMLFFTCNLQRTLFLDTFIMIYLFLGYMVLSYGVSFVASLSFEAPMMGLERVIFRRP